MNKERLEEVAGIIDLYIHPFTVSKTWKGLIKLSKQDWSDFEITEACKAGSNSYLRTGSDGKRTKDSVDYFLGKLGGIMFNTRLQAQNPEMLRLHLYVRELFPHKKPWQRQTIYREIDAALSAGITMQSIWRAVRMDVDDIEQLRGEIKKLTPYSSIEELT